jgi:TldD protein
VFSANEAYLIKNGKISHPVKGATLIGSGDEALKKISMVANDLKLDSGVGVCGKDGQSVPVGVGQPSLKIDEFDNFENCTGALIKVAISVNRLFIPSSKSS